jgi:Ni/Co efflux regulator RcnB
MKLRLAIAIALVAVLAAAFAAVAGAATDSTVKGSLSSVAYDVSAKTGKVHVMSSRGAKTTVSLNAKTNCGVSYATAGEEIQCKTLVSSKYRNKPLNVTAKRYTDGHRVAVVVVVDLSK